jgi:alpha-L-rhamnosidase
MLKNGATTLWESWEKPDQNSLNHPMFGSVSEWFYRALLGINPAEDACGMDRVILQPFTGGGTDLQFVKGYYQSIRGRIISEWEKNRNMLNWKVAIPPNMRAQICIPAKNLQSILENGQPIARAKGLTFLSLENGYALFDAVSGTYHFSIRD